MQTGKAKAMKEFIVARRQVNDSHLNSVGGFAVNAKFKRNL